MSRFTNNLLGVARKHSATGLRHPDFQQPGFRIPKGPKRARSPEYDAEDLPEWAEFDENESLAFLDRNMEYEHPAVLDKVAEPNGLVSARSRECVTIINSGRMRFMLRMTCLI